ncbi:MAG: hypothetical protein ACD_2C00057G0003 [uncultured bacterium (gcode 4)]|uniref:Uncharacterized protein n=1 Tax=uncultured bacterium (gcode 4) TaxID=1234023 RepID=K2G458_9BACT|nr:MAG: hypothetical protein ACD_2C00057G0003 [uncultured bacterium (gcode 4)]
MFNSLINKLIKPIIDSTINKSKRTKFLKAFTLVELIVVIVILAILSTIAFIAFFDYNKSARDSVRVSDIGLLSKSFEISRIWVGKFPKPDAPSSITFSWAEVWTQWRISDWVIKFLNINKKPLDPQFKTEYSYSLTSNGQEYQIWAVSERDISYSNPFIEKWYASDNESWLIAYTKWTYDELFVSAKDSSSCYIVATPSLLLSELPTSLKLEDAWNDSLVYRWEWNLPETYNESVSDGSLSWSFIFKDFTDDSVLIYTWCTVPNSLTWALEFASDTKKAYAGTDFDSVSSNEISLTINADSLARLGIWYINNNLMLKWLSWNRLNVDFATAVMPNFTCAPQPIMTHANSFTIWNPTDFDQEWAYSDTAWNCTFACDSWYAYDPNTKSCIQDICIWNLSDLNWELIQWSTQSATKSWTYSPSETAWTCSYKCAAGHSFDSWQNKCTPDNCSAQSVIINGHTYDIPWLNHDATTHKTSSQSLIDWWKVTFDDDFKCSLWVISETWNETQNTPVCNSNYSVNGLTCKADSKSFNCSAKPANTLWNTVSSYSQTWNWTAWIPADTTTSYNVAESSNACNYICDNGFHTENSWASCISDIKSCSITNWTWKQTWNTTTKTWWSCNVLSCNADYVEQGNVCVADQCGWAIPANWVSNTTSQTVSKIWAYNLTPWQCTFKCDTNYTWDSGSNTCNADTKTFTCPSTKPANTVWNSVSSYAQTWNGVAWLPANSTTDYNTTASATSCRYNCSPWFHTEDWWNSCVSNTAVCTIANWTWNKTWNWSSWWTCTVTSCNSWYTSSSNTCIASNCVASTQTVNWHSYSLSAFNHSTTQSKSTTIAISNGNRTYTQVFSCDFGNISPSWTESDSPDCNTNYTWNWWSCVAWTQTFTCAATKPANTVWNTVSSYTQTWNWSAWSPSNSSTSYNTAASTSSCNYKCSATYHTENSWSTCVSDTKSCTISNWAWTQTWNWSAWGLCIVTSCNSGYVEQSNLCVADVCGWTVPANWSSNATSQTVSKSWGYNLTPGQCTFKCDTNYTWNWTACVANTQTYTCAAKPSNTDWNTVSSFNQTWNGSAWLPANSATTYNTTASTTACNYKCSSWFHDESWCVSNTRSCSITDWAWSQTWSSAWWACNVTSCNSWYVISWNSCVPANCTTPWSTTVNNWSSVTAYSAVSATSPTTCAWISQTRTCTNWVLSGSFWNQSCTQQYRSCTAPWWTVIAHWGTITAYSSSSVAYWNTCASQVRTCSDGTFNWTYASQTCTVAAPGNCTVAPFWTIAHWSSVTAWISWTPYYPDSCLSQTRTCTNWALSWWYGFTSCTQMYSYSWITWSFWACSATCWWWTQSRSVVCRRSDGANVADSYCSSKPATGQSCNTQACPINWACNNAVQYSCSLGTSTSNVAWSCWGSSTWTCAWLNWWTSANCSKANVACPVNCTYTTSAWWACSASCGWWTQYRYYSVTIPASNGWTCPVTNGQLAWSQSCNTLSCGPGTCDGWNGSYDVCAGWSRNGLACSSDSDC